MSHTSEIEKAIDSYIKENAGAGSFLTGWVAVASLSHPNHEIGEQDTYITINSDGMPHHSVLGLINVASDDLKNTIMISRLHSFFMSGYGEDEQDGDD